MESFSIEIVFFALMIFIPLAYFLNSQLRHLDTWPPRKPSVKQRFGMAMVLTVMFIFVVSSIVPTLWDKELYEKIIAVSAVSALYQ